MPDSQIAKAPTRKNFSKILTSISIPNLIEVQKQSYAKFLQLDVAPEQRADIGLQAVFKSVFPIHDFRGTCSLEYVSYSIGNWELDSQGRRIRLKHKYSIEECQERGMTFAAPLKVRIRLVVWDKDPESNAKNLHDIKEQEVYFGDIPLMTVHGTFIINGTERVIVSQLHRSPGVFFSTGDDKNSLQAQIIPYRGSWVEFEFDSKNLLYVRIDRKRKFLATVFLKALGLRDDESVLRVFYRPLVLHREGERFELAVAPELEGMTFPFDLVGPKGETLLASGKKATANALEKLRKVGLTRIPLTPEYLATVVPIADVVDDSSGEVVVEANSLLVEEALGRLQASAVTQCEVVDPAGSELGPVLADTLRKDAVHSTEEALVEIYRRLRPGDPPTLESSRNLFKDMFFNPYKYDFSRVGRLKFNAKLGLEGELEERLLKAEDFYAVISYLLKLRTSIGEVDDIDHLGNRRVRSVGELLENQFRIGLVRMERAIKERMSVFQEIATAMPHDLINAKPVLAALREFFGSSQLSQFMDQTNPLSEITHKRRLSALGPGGLSRERAGFEVRDVHPTHYGRICPIETPEGPNIGLISSLSSYAQVNEFGFIESPFRRVREGRVLDEWQVLDPGDSGLEQGAVLERHELQAVNDKAGKKGGKPAQGEPYCYYLSAWEEDQYVIAQANAVIEASGRFAQERLTARKGGEFALVRREEVDYIDVSPKQLVSVATSLIPFLEHDDANRALMGSNMQRQAVPLLQPEAPLVGTGMEGITAIDSGAVVVAKRAGMVEYVDAQRIVVRADADIAGGVDSGADIYTLIKFKRSNQNTCINQQPRVRPGQAVEKGDVLADGPATQGGELALGRNILVAFMPWRGYNFEDAIVVGERLVRDDYYTSIHIEEFEIESRDTKLGPEEITRDIPNVSEEALAELDGSGIIRIGASIKPGDILVGKVTPKGETQLTPEEKLLRAIFGEKAEDVRDASLTCPPGIEGIVVDAKVFSRKGVEKDERAQSIAEEEVAKLRKDLEDELRILNAEYAKKVLDLVHGKTLAEDLVSEDSGELILAKKTKLAKTKHVDIALEDLARMEFGGDGELEMKIAQLHSQSIEQAEAYKRVCDEKIDQYQKGDELPPGVIKLVKVYVAMKRKLSVGDKMAGRHGNKGVIARIVPQQDMPYLPDGTPVDIVLNPLGVPSRMNVGQLLETQLGWAAQVLGLKVASPVFDGAAEQEIRAMMREAKLPENSKTVLYDGMSGEPFDSEVTVGCIYMMKLSHLVDDKIHARSIGPYSLITQQPLGGKAQFGGQRFGEMEVWALEAYGAAHTLQELLTAKSDDVYGRAKIYEAIVKGEVPPPPGLPESFNVLIRELQSLCLDVELVKSGDDRS